MKQLVLFTMSLVVLASSVYAVKVPGAFKRNDANKDGLLTKDEYVAARIDGVKHWFVKHGPGLEAYNAKFPNPEKQFAADFQKWDSNGDGLVDVAEWINKGK
jgi:Ca2+-binding EF-hand superfamily protein